jgi:hypothetical protein
MLFSIGVTEACRPSQNELLFPDSWLGLVMVDFLGRGVVFIANSKGASTFA